MSEFDQYGNLIDPTANPPNPVAGDARSARSLARENRVASLETDVGALKNDVQDIKVMMQTLLQRLPPPPSDPPIPTHVDTGAGDNQNVPRRGAGEDLELPNLGDTSTIAEEKKDDPPAPVDTPAAPVEDPRIVALTERLNANQQRLEETLQQRDRDHAEQLEAERRGRDIDRQERSAIMTALTALLERRDPPPRRDAPDPPILAIDTGQRGQNYVPPAAVNNEAPVANNLADQRRRRSTMSLNLERTDGLRVVTQEFLPHNKEPPCLTSKDPGHVCNIFMRVRAYETRWGSRVFAAASLDEALAEEVSTFRSHQLGFNAMSVSEVMLLPNHVLLDRLSAMSAPKGFLHFFDVLKANVPERIPELDNHRYGADTLDTLMTHLRKYRISFETVYEFLAAYYTKMLPPCTTKPEEGLIWLFGRALFEPWFKNVSRQVLANHKGPLDSILVFIDELFGELGKEVHYASEHIEIDMRNQKANDAKKITGAIPSTAVVLGQHRPQQRAAINNLEYADAAPYPAQEPSPASFNADPGLSQALQSIADVLGKINETQSNLAAVLLPDTELEKQASAPENFAWAFTPKCARPETDSDAHGYAVAVLCQIGQGGEMRRKFVRICRFKWKYGHCPGESTGECDFDHSAEGEKSFCSMVEDTLRRSRYSVLYDPNAKRPTPSERDLFRVGQKRPGGQGRAPPGLPPYTPHSNVAEPPRTYVPPNNQHPNVLHRPAAPNNPVDVHRLQAIIQQAGESNPYETDEEASYWRNWTPEYAAAAQRAETKALAATGAQSIPHPDASPGDQAAGDEYQR